MMNFEGKAELRKVEILSLTPHDEGTKRNVRMEFEVELDGDSIDEIPVASQAIRQLIVASNKVDTEEKNTMTLNLKFKYEPALLTIVRNEEGEVSFGGTPVLAPSVSVVKGEAKLKWKVEASLFSSQLEVLSGHVGCIVDLVSSIAQTDIIDFADAQAAAAQ